MADPALKPAAVTDFGQYAELRALARNENPEALRKVAQQFEAVFTQMLLKSMRDASFGDDLMGGGQTGFYRDMFDQQLAVHLSAGKGLGIADLMVRQLQMAQGLAEKPGLGTEQPGLGTRDSGLGNGSAPALKLAQSLSPVSRLVAAPVEAPATSPNESAVPNPESRVPSPGFTESRVPSPGLTPSPGFNPASPEEFVQTLLPHAEKAAAALGVPARVIVAQAALETGWGRHLMRHSDGSPAFNFFGIKADNRWEGARVRQSTLEFEDGHMQRVNANFRSYGSIAEAFEDYVSFIKSNPRYAEALRHGGDESHYAAGLQKAGYATDPRYAQKILRIAGSDALSL